MVPAMSRRRGRITGAILTQGAILLRPVTGAQDREQFYRRWSATCLVLMAIGCAVGVIVPAGIGWDFANFYDAGRRVAAGQAADLYAPRSLIAGQPPQGSTGFFGAPLSALFYVPLAGFDAAAALVLFKVQNVAAFAVTFVVLFTFCRPFVSGGSLEQSRFAAQFAFFCLVFQPFWTVFRVGGQTTPTVLMLLAIGLVLHTRGRFWGSAATVVLAALIKPALAPALLLLAAISGIAFAWRLGATLAASGLLSLALVGWPAHAAFLDLMQRSAGRSYAWYFNSSVYILLDSLRQYAGPGASAGLQGSLSIAMWALRGAVAVGTLWLVYRSWREPWPASARRHFHFTLTTLFFLLWSPIVWEHYLALLFLPLIYVVAAQTHFNREALGIVAAILFTSIAQNLILINWVREHVAFDSVLALAAAAIVKSAPLLLTIVLVSRHWRHWFGSYTAAAWRSLEAAQPQRGDRVAGPVNS
jgi:hypothetical protein